MAELQVDALDLVAGIAAHLDVFAAVVNWLELQQGGAAVNTNEDVMLPRH